MLLKLYLENQLADLNVAAESSGAFPMVGGPPPMPHAVTQAGAPSMQGAPGPFGGEPVQHSGAFQGVDGPHNDRR